MTFVSPGGAVALIHASYLLLLNFRYSNIAKVRKNHSLFQFSSI